MGNCGRKLERYKLIGIAMAVYYRGVDDSSNCTDGDTFDA